MSHQTKELGIKVKILIGIMHCIENEFQQCIESIKNQTHKNFDYFVIESFPNKEAHNRLYCTFMDKAQDYDLFVKVDADMVITNQLLFTKIIEFFEKNDSIKCLKLAVHDYFANRLICGMHIYQNTVKWTSSPSQLFVDIHNNSLHFSEILSIMSPSPLTPAAIHCPNPSKFQSFHYGVHKGLKIIQPDIFKFDIDKANYHWNIVENIREHLKTTNDSKLGFAVLGAELAFRGKILPKHLDFNNPYLLRLFKRYENYSLKQLNYKIFILKFSKLGFLPHKLRRILLCGSKYIKALYEQRNTAPKKIIC